MSKAKSQKPSDLVAELTDLVEKLAHLGKEEGVNLKNTLENEFHPQIEKIRKRLKDTKEKSQEWADTLEETVISNPWKSLLTAAAIGYVIGKFFDRD